MAAIMFMLCGAIAFGGGDEKTKAPTEVRVKATAAARGLDLTIGELCEIQAADGAISLALGQIKFGPAPVLGFTRTIGRAELLQSLAAAGIDLSTIKLVGFDEVVVQAIAVEVPAQDMLEAATAALQAQLAVEGGDVEYEAPARLRQVQAPPGRRSQELRARVRGAKTGPNSAVVDIEVLVDGEVGKKVPVNFKLQRYQRLLKTAAPLRAGTPLGPDTLELVREPMDQGSSLFLARLDQVEGMLAARNLQAGQRLTLGDIAPPAVIRKGDIVTVVLTKGRVKVTARAMANHDAPLGARLIMTNTTSRSTLTGIVQAPGLVVVPQ